MSHGDEFNFPKFDWQRREMIGEGGFGKVFKVRSKQNGEYFAIKQMSMDKFQQAYQKQALKTEIYIMKELSSPYTVSMYDAIIGEKYTYIILQLCDSDLKKQLQANGNKLPQSYCSQIFNEVMKGFKLLLDKGYIHRDVKPQNILIKNKFHKIADFGFSKKIDVYGTTTINEICGTPLYMAPQLLFNKQYSSKCDIWSLGLMLYQMLFGYGPWPNRHFESYKHSVINNPVSFPYKCKIGKTTRDFIKKCLMVQQKERLDWKQLLNHPFIASKDTGKAIQYPILSTIIQNIFIRVQQSAYRKGVNVLKLFQQKSKCKKLDRSQFFTFIQQIDPMITTYQSQMIFKTSDTTQDGFIQMNEFQSMFCDVDYRPPQDIVARHIQQLIAMAQSKGLNIRQFFSMFDTNQSGTIEQDQFIKFMHKIAPRYSMNDLKMIWNRFDSDKSGKIQAKQFLTEMTRSVPNMQSHIGINRQRAKRNLMCLKSHLKQNKITPEQMIIKGDKDHNKCLTIQEFGPMIQAINYVITKQEIKQMFCLLDRNDSLTIEINEVRQFLS